MKDKNKSESNNKTDNSLDTDKANDHRNINEGNNKLLKEKSSTQKTNSEIKPTIKKKTESPEKKENLFNSKPIPKMESSKNKKSNLLPAISFILILLLFSVSAWIYYQQQLTIKSLQNIKEEVINDLEIQSTNISKVSLNNSQVANDITQLKIGLQNLAKYNDDLKRQLTSAQEKIKSLSGRRKQDWMLSEVEYLINTAELKLALQKDRKTAIQLLKTADDRLLEISDQSLLPIREAIAKDISNLSLIQESDITGIVITLNTLDQQVSKLELLSLKFEDVSSEQNINDENLENKALKNNSLENKTDETSLADFSKIYTRFVKEFIVIKEHAETPQPLMTPDQRGNLNQNIQLSLQQAQIAALQGNEQLFILNLDKAIKWIKEYFGKSSEAKSILKQLEELKSEKIDVRYPTQLESSVEVESINQGQLYNWLDNSLNPSSPKITTDSQIKEIKSDENLEQQEQQDQEAKKQ